jgi:hypothetical protein
VSRADEVSDRDLKPVLATVRFGAPSNRLTRPSLGGPVLSRNGTPCYRHSTHADLPERLDVRHEVGGAMRRHLHCSEPRTSQQPGEGVWVGET